MDKFITFSMARIKLRIRHLLESDKLTAIQQKVLKLIREETALKRTAFSGSIRAVIDLIRKQTARYIDLMAYQQEDRAQMKRRHRQEKAALEQVIETSK
jgi:hypothetical protein